MSATRTNGSEASTRTSSTRLAEVREPDLLALLFGARAVFVREDTGSGERFALMLVEARDGGYMVLGDAPKSVFVENRPDVEAWRFRQDLRQRGYSVQ
jgi:hypothetical protein